MGISKKLGYDFIVPVIKQNNCKLYRCHTMNSASYWQVQMATLGFKRFMTEQDGAYFMQWISESELASICYCEGDFNIVEAPNKLSYDLEIIELIAWRETM